MVGILLLYFAHTLLIKFPCLSLSENETIGGFVGFLNVELKQESMLGHNSVVPKL